MRSLLLRWDPEGRMGQARTNSNIINRIQRSRLPSLMKELALTACYRMVPSLK